MGVNSLILSDKQIYIHVQTLQKQEQNTQLRGTKER